MRHNKELQNRKAQEHSSETNVFEISPVAVKRDRKGLTMSTTATATEHAASGPRALVDIRRECEEVARTRPGDTHKMASLLSQMSLNYYQDVRRQAQQSFYSALVAAVVGTLFFIYAALTMNQTSTGAYIGLIAGALVQVISGINFYLYGRAARQFASFHVCLERTNRFLLANTLCENINCPNKQDAMRAELIRTIANAPMLSMDGPQRETSTIVGGEFTRTDLTGGLVRTSEEASIVTKEVAQS